MHVSVVYGFTFVCMSVLAKLDWFGSRGVCFHACIYGICMWEYVEVVEV